MRIKRSVIEAVTSPTKLKKVHFFASAKDRTYACHPQTEATTNPNNATMSAAAPPPIKIVPPGPREVVSPERAQEFVNHWTQQLLDHRVKVQEALNDDDVNNTVLCDRISLTNKSYTPEAAEIIANFLKEPFEGGLPITYGIVEANLSDMIASQLTEQGLKVLRTICDAFADSELVEVDLSDNAVGEQGIGACRVVVNKSSLKALSLNNMGMAHETLSEVADILTNDEYGNGCIAERLTKFHYFNNMSGIEGCKAFARILEKSRDLVDLRFSSTRARQEGTDILAGALDACMMNERNANLQRLDLCDNQFGNKPSQEALFRILGATKSLTYLNLCDCSLGDDGVKKVCHALFESDSQLEHLDLSANELSRKGAKHVADFIRDCEGLKVLRMEDNEITSKGVELLAQAFHRGEDGIAIEEIQLNCNMIGALGARALIDAAGPDGSDMPNLRLIQLNNNSFASDVMSELEAAFGNKLGEMDENDSDGEADDDLSSDEEDSDSDEEGEAEGDRKVDALTDALEKSLIV